MANLKQLKISHIYSYLLYKPSSYCMKRILLIIFCATVYFNAYGSIRTDTLIKKIIKKIYRLSCKKNVKGVRPAKNLYIIPQTADEAPKN